ncbi:MAG: hypothetical protein F6K14_32985 [Symploca sp. SIO2C1]|nr:hypothetical protein [Symploca sp. SIO2C1]
MEANLKSSKGWCITRSLTAPYSTNTYLLMNQSDAWESNCWKSTIELIAIAQAGAVGKCIGSILKGIAGYRND